MFRISDLRPPIVSDTDRQWAIAECPRWARIGSIANNEIVDDGEWLETGMTPKPSLDAPNWTIFVAEQVERFEKFFADTGELKTRGDWSRLWRLSWWPKAHPEKRFPRSAPKVFHPFFKSGTEEFNRALKVGDAKERRMWKQFGVAQFKPDDQRLAKVCKTA